LRVAGYRLRVQGGMNAQDRSIQHSLTQKLASYPTADTQGRRRYALARPSTQVRSITDLAAT